MRMKHNDNITRNKCNVGKLVLEGYPRVRRHLTSKEVSIIKRKEGLASRIKRGDPT
jgi:hypothetical protein